MTLWLVARSLLDRVAAAVLLVVVAPVISVCACLKRLEDRGPAFVRLARVGKGGVPFRMLKMRTMVAAQPGGSAGGSGITAGADDRVTRFGRSLRKHHLDELPQLLNVLSGDMALVGPRPEAPAYVSETELWRRVLRARPGVAGPTQVLFADIEAYLPAVGTESYYLEVLLPAKLAVDAWYVEHASPKVDAVVLRSLLAWVLLDRPPDRLWRMVEQAVDVPANVQRLRRAKRAPTL